MRSLISPIFTRRPMKSSIATFLRVKSDGFEKNWAGYKQEQSTASWSASQTGWSVLRRESFNNVIFTDECSVHMENHAKLLFWRNWELLKMKGCPKHLYKFHIWDGISKRGATKVLIFSSNTDAQFYTEDILKGTVPPIIRKKFADGHCFQQDNDPNHTSTLAKKFMKRESINWWKTPPDSPDLNPIELLCHEMTHLLVASITRFWQERVTPGKCAFTLTT